ncbi:MAG TPA: hypothetical protein VLS89_10855, partial [Candidatus Nanopelagicales bacterium]|nr:hypothetical protein [Candidatus Nanopelagicales bacterium]
MKPRYAAILASLAALAAPARGLPASSPGDDILFVGMTRGSAVEARALRATGARVVQILDATEPDRIRADADGQDHDLTVEHGILGFVGTLGLPGPQAASVAATIGGAMDDSRDELARIAEIWARAERGGSAPPRLVLSGHSAGESV